MLHALNKEPHVQKNKKRQKLILSPCTIKRSGGEKEQTLSEGIQAFKLFLRGNLSLQSRKKEELETSWRIAGKSQQDHAGLEKNNFK